jgi:hypothetical protein
VEWTTAVFGVFWGVWWADVAKSVVEGRGALLLWGRFSVSRPFGALFVASYVTFFSYTYVKFLWQSRSLHWDVALREFIKCTWRVSLAVLGLISASVYFYTVADLSLSQLVYGGVLTVSWLVTAIMVTLQSGVWI